MKKTIVIRLDDKIVKDADIYAFRNGITRSDVIRMAIERIINDKSNSRK